MGTQADEDNGGSVGVGKCRNGELGNLAIGEEGEGRMMTMEAVVEKSVSVSLARAVSLIAEWRVRQL